MTTRYGDIPEVTVKNYFKSLVGKTYKILPMKEENSKTLKSYIESYCVELLGVKLLIEVLQNEPQFLSLLSILTYLANGEYNNSVCKREVFKCIRIINSISESYFEGV